MKARERIKQKGGSVRKVKWKYRRGRRREDLRHEAVKGMISAKVLRRSSSRGSP